MGGFDLASILLLSSILTNVLAISLNVDDPGMYISKASDVLDLADMARINSCSCCTCGIRHAATVQWQSEQWGAWKISIPSILLVSRHSPRDAAFLLLPAQHVNKLQVGVWGCLGWHDGVLALHSR